jgi:hypothetical protein
VIYEANHTIKLWVVAEPAEWVAAEQVLWVLLNTTAQKLRDLRSELRHKTVGAQE